MTSLFRVADLQPPLGKPGGPCQVVNRIEKRVTNPKLQDALVEDVQEGKDLSNQEASKVYRLEHEPGVGPIRSIEITSHGQYRMDLRHITVDLVRQALNSFLTQMAQWKAIQSKAYENMGKALEGGEEISWVDPKTHLKVVFRHSGNGNVVLITTYWKGRDNLNKPGPEVCDYDRRQAAIKTIDLEWVESLRKDFLTLMKNFPRVKNYQEARKLSDAFRVYRSNFDRLFFDRFLNKDLKEFEKYGISEGDAKYIDKKLRSVAWTFSTALSNVSSIRRPDDYWSEDACFADYQKDMPARIARVKRNAQVFWKDLREILEWLQALKQKGFEVYVPDVDQVVLEGFQATIRGYRNKDYQQESLGLLKEGLKVYRRNAAARLPLLLKKQVPLDIEFETTLDQLGEYDQGIIRFYTSGATRRTPERVAHVMAHEMGHHLWKTYLNGSQREFWVLAIKEDYGVIDLGELLRSWPGDLWAFQFPEALAETDPLLALQVNAISHDRSYAKELQSKEDFQALYDAGERTLKVPKTPITGYANKNPEEAFCEAVGLLVAYGPGALLEPVRWWLSVVLPGAIKTAGERRKG